MVWPRRFGGWYRRLRHNLDTRENRQMRQQPARENKRNYNENHVQLAVHKMFSWSDVVKSYCYFTTPLVMHTAQLPKSSFRKECFFRKGFRVFDSIFDLRCSIPKKNPNFDMQNLSIFSLRFGILFSVRTRNGTSRLIKWTLRQGSRRCVLKDANNTDSDEVDLFLVLPTRPQHCSEPRLAKESFCCRTASACGHIAI